MGLRSLSYPPKPAADGDTTVKPVHVLIYFITGNPGLIDYYAPFLSHLRGLLDDSASLTACRFHIYGQDLAGFGDDDHEQPFDAYAGRWPFSLEHQIQLAARTVRSMRIEEEGPRQGDPYDSVLLMGHSVGAYIALQLCHRALREEREREAKPEPDADGALSPRLDSAVLLFPTLEHIARSPAGWKLDLLRRTPLLEANAHRLARLILWPWPRAAVSWFVSRVMGFPYQAAEATTRWLTSRDGVWQALHMGLDEMRTIGEGAWDEDLWGIEREAEVREEAQQQKQEKEQRHRVDKPAPAPTPKFYFFFGKHDHWVANHYRDIFIEKRRKQVERTRLMVDEGDLPHAFCIRHSETVAEKVCTWIQEMYGSP
ncbi:hypothetical protein DL765_002254 [Monosporascus sp. GIB2]|nr:hypothetical protein DL765_002254 [Monosporascus sp. GIB2]